MNESSELLAWLEELEAEQAAKALVIASLRQKLGLDPAETNHSPLPTVAPHRASSSPAAHHGPIRGDTFFQLTVPDAIKKYLSIAKRPQSPRAIADALKQGGVLSQAADFYANVTTALTRLARSGDVVNTKEGWGLATWYAGRKPPEPPKPAKKKKKGHKAAKTPTVKAITPKAGAVGKGNTGWHEFLAASLKEGRTMKDAATDWKLRKAAS